MSDHKNDDDTDSDVEAAFKTINERRELRDYKSIDPEKYTKTVSSRLDNAIKQLQLAREKTDDPITMSNLDYQIRTLKRLQKKHD